MLFYEFKVKEKVYKLKLNTRNIISLEKDLKCNPLMIFGMNGDRIPTISEMVSILFASLQNYQNSLSLNDAYSIFDEWLEDDNTITDFIPIILEIYKVSGLIREETNEKN